MLKSKLPRAIIEVIGINSAPAAEGSSCQIWDEFLRSKATPVVPNESKMESKGEGAGVDITQFSDPLAEMGDIHFPAAGSSASSSSNKGLYCTAEDASVLEKSLWDIIVNGVFLKLAETTKHLYGEIAKNRQGAFNQFKNMFRSRPNDPTLVLDPDFKYEADSIESQIKRLADWLFLMHDYGLALDHYNMVWGDYKTDKAKHYLASTSVRI
jgi:hypothetical protein